MKQLSPDFLPVKIFCDCTIRRFAKKINVTDTCWLWTSAKNNKGYGLFRANGKAMLAHRVSYIIANGNSAITGGPFLLHSCDTPACVNPEHLRPGTNLDNVRDMISKGRHSHGPRHAIKYRGENNNTTILKISQVLEIRKIYSGGGISQRQLAKDFNVTEGCIGSLIRRKSWKHI